MTPQTTEYFAERYGSAYKWYATAAVMVGCIATVLASTMTNVAMPDIMGEFGMGQDQVQWLSTAFLASMTTSMLTTAWVVANFGTKKAYLASLSIFTVGSLLGGLSSGDGMLILARTIQGAGAGLVQPVAMLVVFGVFDARKRGMAMGIYSLGIVLAPALGPTVGGILIDDYSWRYIFFLGIPLCLLGATMGLAFLPTHVKRAATSFDLPGFVMLCLAVGSFLAGLSNGQRQGWDSNFVLGAFGLSACAAAGFLWRESTCQAPLLALGVYKNPKFLAASVVSFILGLGLFGSTYLIPLFVQTLQGYSPTQSGLLLMPAGLVVGAIAPMSGRLADQVQPYVLIIIGLALFGWSCLLMADVGSSTAFWDLTLWVMLGRVGMGLLSPSLNSGAMRVLKPEHMGHGAGNINFMRQLGGAVGVSLLSVYLDRQTTLYGQAFNALQTGTHAAADTLDVVATLLYRAGLVDNVAQATRTDAAHHFLSEMISAQAQVMGFRECFLLAGMAFFAAILPAWFMRPGKRRKMVKPAPA